MNTYTNRFEGPNRSPSQLSYNALTITTNTQLIWPFQTGVSTNYAASKVGITASAGLSVLMPDATLVSTGQDVLLINDGANTYTVKDYDGSNIGSVASGENWLFWLTDVADQAGTWQSIELGTGTSSATAASLAGYGLEPITTKLNVFSPVTSTAAAHLFVKADQASTWNWTGGVGTFTFDPAATLDDGWWTAVRNSGSGTLTLNPAEDIDGEPSKALLPGESCEVHCDGTEFITVGFGRATSTTVTQATIDIAGTGVFSTMTALQRAARVQNFVGTLTGNRTVYYDTSPGYWMVYNNTTGDFSVTFAVDGSDAGVVVDQGSYRVLRNDGTNVKMSSPNDGAKTYALSGSFVWPVCSGAIVHMVGPGGGGGRGDQGGTTSGAGGGGGGVQAFLISPPPAVGTTTTVTLGAAGAGASANNTSGTNGGDCTFGTLCAVTGGRGGGVGTAGAGAGGTGSTAQATPVTVATGDVPGSSSSEWGGAAGDNGSTAGSGLSSGRSSVHGGPGGGAGGGNGPGDGSAGGSTGTRAVGGGGAGGTGGAAGSAGAVGTNGNPGKGGGGGGGHATAGGAGGAGGAPGAGGGGGGWGSVTSGNGGIGGAAQVVVTWW